MPLPPKSLASNPPPGSPVTLRLGFGLPLRDHAFVWGGLALLALVLLTFSSAYQGQSAWTGWVESRELRQPSYAERIYAEHLFRTRSNTWSNLAFVVVGFYALALGGRDLRRPAGPADGYVLATPALSLLFGLACCLLGFGSGFYHASLSRWGQQLDVASMYPPLLVCIALHLGRWLRRFDRAATPRPIPLWTLLAALVVVTSYLLYRFKWSMSSATVLTTLILITAGGALGDAVFARRTLRFRWLAASTLALAAAVVCRQLDIAGKFSGPDAWLQGHALWHGLTALSLACAYAYHRSERPAR
jgi:hypothetical protein